MVPTGERQRLPARERWFWAGVGGVSALAILLFGLALAATITARSAPKQGIVHRSATASVSRLKPVPAPPVAHSPKPAPRIVRKKTLKPVVRVVERPVKAEEHSASAPAPNVSGLAPPPTAGRAGPKPLYSGAQPKAPDRVAGSREEWKPGFPRGGQAPGSETPEGTSTGRSLEVTPPRLVRSRGADYPTSAMEDGVTGKVRLELEVGPDGYVDRAEVTHSSGDARLDAAAARAALTWRYQPARRNGRPVPSADSVQFEFFRREGQ